MSSFETHHPAVCAWHMTGGVVREAWHTRFYQKAGLALSVALYWTIGWLLEKPMAVHVVWDAFFLALWTFIWVYLPRIVS